MSNMVLGICKIPCIIHAFHPCMSQAYSMHHPGMFHASLFCNEKTKFNTEKGHIMLSAILAFKYVGQTEMSVEVFTI